MLKNSWTYFPTIKLYIVHQFISQRALLVNIIELDANQSIFFVSFQISMNLFHVHSHFRGRKMSAVIFLQLFVITLLSLPYLSVEQVQPKDYACTTKEKCDECIRTFGCVWCSDPVRTFFFFCHNYLPISSILCNNGLIIEVEKKN